ncbi:uncharacterized protein ACWYII_008386 isoform 1-T2 [Salvelinus alpinus]
MEKANSRMKQLRRQRRTPHVPTPTAGSCRGSWTMPLRPAKVSAVRSTHSRAASGVEAPSVSPPAARAGVSCRWREDRSTSYPTTRWKTSPRTPMPTRRQQLPNQSRSSPSSPHAAWPPPPQPLPLSS